MVSVVIFISGFLVGILMAYIFLCGRSRKNFNPSIANYVEKQHSEKQARKEKILALLHERMSVTNNDIEKTLNVSDTTATNYLQELEREGKIEQIGERGRFVSYRKRD